MVQVTRKRISLLPYRIYPIDRKKGDRNYEQK